MWENALIRCFLFNFAYKMSGLTTPRDLKSHLTQYEWASFDRSEDFNYLEAV